MNYKRIIILVVVLGLLTAGYFLVNNLDNKEVEEPTPTPQAIDDDIILLDYNNDDISGFTVRYSDGNEFDFKTKEVTEEVETTDDNGETITENETKTVWYIENHEDLITNEIILGNIATILTPLIADDIIVEETDDLSQYGLDTDYITLDVYGKENNTLKIGSETLTGSGYYVMKEGDKKVYLVNSYDINKLIVSRLSLQNKEVCSFDYKTVKDIKFNRDDQKVFEAYRQDEFEYQLTYPIEVLADYADIEAMLTALTPLSATEYVDENPSDLGQYGLSEPLYEFILTTDDDKEYVIQFGKETGSGAIYAKTNSSGFIFTTSLEPFGFLDKPIEDIMDSFVNLASIWEVEEVRVTMDGRTDITKINVAKDEETNATTIEEYIFNGYTFDDSNEELVSLFKKYYQGIIGLTVNKVDTQANPSGEPEIVIEYLYKDNAQNVKLELVPAEDDISYYVIKNGEYSGIKTLIRELEKDADSLKVAYKNFVEQLPQQ